MAPTVVNSTKATMKIDKPTIKEQPNKREKIKRIFRVFFKWCVFLLLLLGLIVSAFVGAVRYEFLDPAQIGLPGDTEQYPIIGKYLKPPVLEQELEPEEIVVPEQPKAAVLPSSVIPTLPKPSAPLLAPLKIDDAELKRNEQLKREEDQKRLSKVVRLYEGMKPEEAVIILNEIDDATVVLLFSKMDEERTAKIMTLLDPKRSARLSDAMLKGRLNSL